jgi:hypothetical protein
VLAAREQHENRLFDRLFVCSASLTASRTALTGKVSLARFGDRPRQAGVHRFSCENVQKSWGTPHKQAAWNL